jgi:predicted RNase H-like HicB family nuclease
MKVKVVVHEAEEGGYWAEVPAIPGCATQGETYEELIANLHEAIEACLSVDVQVPHTTGKDRVLEIAVGRRSLESNLRGLWSEMVGSSCEFMGATTFTEKPAARCACQFPSMETNR